MQSTKHTYIIFFFLSVMIGIVLIAINQTFDSTKADITTINQEILGVDTQISAEVPITELTFKVYPEKRIPTINNWDTYVDITLQNCNNATQYNFSHIPTNQYGIGTIPVSIFVAGDYRFFIKGHSHLRRIFNCYPIYTTVTNIDLTLENKELIAGEISPTKDNYINSLDISVIINNLFTNDYTSDLNQDGHVNSLDFSNQIFNLFITGE